MSLNDDKTAITSFDEGFAFLGEDIGPVHPVVELGSIQRGDALQKALYVNKQGAGVSVRKGQFVVHAASKDLLRAPVSLVGHIVLLGSIGLSAGARAVTLRDQIEVTFLSKRGKWLGRQDNGELGRATLRREQYRCGDVADCRLELSRPFVLGKIANMRALLSRYGRRGPVPQVVGATTQLKENYRAAKRSTSLEQLRGYEGAATRAYFDGLRYLFPEGAGFSGRNRRPPKDPANAALSFGYAVLLGEVLSAVALVGLDPVGGFLHLDHEKRPSLALDLMEEVRPVIVDTTVLDLFRREILTSEHFTTDHKKQGVFLNQVGRRRLLEGLNLDSTQCLLISHLVSALPTGGP